VRYQYPPAPGQRVGRYIGSCADEAHAESAPLTDLRRPGQGLTLVPISAQLELFVHRVTQLNS